MKRPLAVMAVCAALVVGGGAFAQEHEQMKMQPMPANPGFDAMKSLTGNWEGTTSTGAPVKASYEVVAGGSTVLERLDPPDHGIMITMYHVENGNLVMDHYCAMNNIPHMKATRSADGKVLDFQFVSASNLPSQKDTHMHSLKLTFKDADHLQHEWSLHENGKATPVVFQLARAQKM